ncbi:sel1 repeat family protein [Heliobacterium chlorum]|uniref:Sel1 repeat family protein n=1 Tax=Heliobacterium chlorum TaxID=2698 RepID=A0ABR7T5C9_HELCL|nr:tetratricopeptide repeat protein [Heliobacterium chlorum]MBC9785140.1 sel1 repeat family protein [Heliobacterium chlorum]
MPLQRVSPTEELTSSIEYPNDLKYKLDEREDWFFLGLCFLEGIGVAKEAVLAAELFKKAAEREHSGGQYELGVCYCMGRGIAQDGEEALRWFVRSADQGYAKAQHNLGVRYSIGKGVPQNAAQAAQWFLKAAKQGHALSQFKLAVMYALGWGVSNDPEQASVWFHCSGEFGAREAAVSINSILQETNDRALWFQEALKNGYTGREFVR